MIIDQDKLDIWRSRVEIIRKHAFAARTRFASGNTVAGNMALDEIATTAAALGVRLEQAGAQRPADLPPPTDTPLELLDTPANRRYERALREAWEAGLEVDRERYGADIGTDGAAQVIEMVLAKVQMEIHGPAGINE